MSLIYKNDSMVIKIRIKPISNTVKNRYDSILKISTHCFVDALIQITDLPEDDYEVVSCQIFQPGNDVKSMDILLKGKNGYVNIEFHKQPLSKSHLNRDFEYVIQCYFFYDEILDQRIIVIDKNRKSVDKIQIMPDLTYKAKYYFTPDYDGASVLNTIENKTINNEELDDFEQYIFSILPLTNHKYDDEEKLMEKLCKLTPKLNIPEKNKEAIGLIQLILVDIFVNDEYLKEKLVDVITMTHSYIEKRENDLKNAIKIEKQKTQNAKQEAQNAEQEAQNAEQEAQDAKQKNKSILKVLADNVDSEGNVKLNKSTVQKIMLM